MSKDAKDVLVNDTVSIGIYDGFINLSRFHIQVATQRTPENTLKCLHTSTGDDTSDIAKMQVLRVIVVLLDIVFQERSRVVLNIQRVANCVLS